MFLTNYGGRILTLSNIAGLSTFVNKVQNKIANLASLIVDRGGDYPTAMKLVLELSDFLECLDNIYTTWTERDILRWMHEYNHLADLNSIPFIQMTGIEINIVIPSGGGISLPITTTDVSDYIPATNILIRNTPHNVLRSIQPRSDYQGYVTNERYHISKAMYDYLYNLINPFITPTVGLVVLPTPSTLYHEKGVAVTSTLLTGSFVLNSGVAALGSRYLKIDSTTNTLVETIGEEIFTYTYATPFFVDTTFRFEVDFTTGGTIGINQSVSFIAPMWYGLGLKGRTPAQVQLLTKVVEGLSSPRDFPISIPANNPNVPIEEVVVPYLLIPISRGTITRIESSLFDTIPDWTITTVTATLDNGDLEPCRLYEFNNTVGGDYTFKVFWT